MHELRKLIIKDEDYWGIEKRKEQADWLKRQGSINNVGAVDIAFGIQEKTLEEKTFDKSLFQSILIGVIISKDFFYKGILYHNPQDKAMVIHDEATQYLKDKGKLKE